MRNNSTIKLIVSTLSAVGLNVVPLALWFFEDYTSETVMLLYAAESFAAIILAVLCVLILAPPQERIENKTLVRSRLIKDFLLIAGMGTLVVYVFIGTFIFLLGKGAGVNFADLKFGLQCIAAFLLVEFTANLFLLRPLSLRQSEFLLSGSFGGIALLMISIFIGVFLGACFGISFFLPFIVFKTLIDIIQPIQFFTGKADAPPALIAEINVKSRRRF